MNLIEKKYLDAYNKAIGSDIPILINNFDFKTSAVNFDYFTKASAVYSSNIEGNSIDLNSYMNYSINKEKTKFRKEMEEIENLIEAYEFAKKSNLTDKNILNCHKIFSNTLLIRSKRGKYREEKIGVFGRSGLAYLAIDPELLVKEMVVFYQDLNELLISPLNETEIFYFASLIHLRFVHIHPFSDGNGKAARLIEKWFIAEKLGPEFWNIPSEEYDLKHKSEYYEAINLGVNFYELNYAKCVKFLEMLPNSLKLIGNYI